MLIPNTSTLGSLALSTSADDLGILLSKPESIFSRAFLAICDPDIELVSRHLQLDGSGHLRGHAAVRRWWETLRSVYPNFTSEIDEVQDLGDVTVARQHFRGEGVASGAQMEQRQWIVTKWRHNRVAWSRSCPTEAEALEVARALGADDESPA